MVRLDGLRGIAVLCVLLFHAGYFLIPTVRERLLPGGFLGVDLFFVLSGFLMTTILLERKQSYGRFYVRRIARIFPALYLLLVVQGLYMWSIGVHPSTGFRADELIAMGVGNWGSVFGVSLPYGLGQTWSLGIEEQLYLLWPLVLVLFGRSDPRRLRAICLLGIAGSMAAKAVMLHRGVSLDVIYSQTQYRLDDFLVGALVASLWQTQKAPIRGLRPLTLLAAGFVGLTLATTDPFKTGSRWLYEGGFTAFAIAGGILLYACLHQSAGTGLAGWRPLRTVGRYSYSIYLWHPLVFMAVSRSFPHDTGLRVLWAASILTGMTLVSTLAIEEPLRRLAARVTAPRPVPKEPVLALTPSG